MPKDKEKRLKLEDLFEMDALAEDGVYIIAPTEEDLAAFAEHARKRIAEKDLKTIRNIK